MNKLIPTVEQLRSDISNIFIDECQDFGFIRDRLNYHLNVESDSQDPELSYDRILEKYRCHIDAWNMRNGEKERRGFVDKTQLRKRKNFLEFLEMKMYQIDWGNANSTPLRDDYLFGTLVTKSNMLNQLKSFKSLWQKEPEPGDYPRDN